MLAGDHLIVLTEDGDVVLVKATPERHEEVASFSAIEGKTWNHPVIADGRLLVRNLREMAAVRYPPSVGPPEGGRMHRQSRSTAIISPLDASSSAHQPDRQVPKFRDA